MKQWAAILALLWVTATMQNAGERHTHPCRAEICAAVVTQAGNEALHADEVPLLATPTLPGSSHLCGASHDAGKGGRHTETASATPGHTPDAGLRGHGPDTGPGSYISDPASVRTTERYIYFLRKIII